MSCAVFVTKTCKVAVERVLVASTRRTRFALSYSARVIVTVSPVVVLGGLIVSVAEREVPFKVALTFALTVAVTCLVLMVKLAEVAPAGTVTVAGTVAEALLLVSATAVDAAAFALNVTVPEAEFPPLTVVGVKVRAEIVAVVGGTGAPLVLSRTSVAPLFPLTSIARSGLLSPLKSAEIM